MIYLYALTERCPQSAPAIEGLGGKPVYYIPDGDLAAVASDSGERWSFTKARALQHEAVVEELMAERVILPTRFGTTLSDKDAVQRILSIQHKEFMQALNHVRGRVELGLRILWQSTRVASNEHPRQDTCSFGTNGQAYLEHLAQREQALCEEQQYVEKLAKQIQEPLLRLAADAQQSLRFNPCPLLSIAFLVERESVDAFRDAVRRLQRQHQHLCFLLTGPWPAYSFSQIALRPPINQESKNARDRSER